ncbi:MAG: pilus assembly protein TadG-related protein, partial [Paracoccaceae bacterium]
MTQQPSPKASKRQIRRHLAKGAARRARRFGRDESGVMIAYSIFFLLIMLIVGGIGVDFMHYEMSRTRLQNTLDRAVLAAADMQQTQDPVAVVEDYLAKAGVDAQLTGTPVVNTGLNYRDVAASATLTVPTQFIHMLGFNSLTAPGAAKAEEKIEAIEIALVLDVSGSMNSNNRLINLKPAAREFIDAVMDLTEEGDVSVSLIPYNTQVSAGPDLLKHYSYEIGGTNTITTLPSELGPVLAAGLQSHLLTPGITQHDYSHCVNFDAASFGSTTIPTNVTLEQTMHFDMFSYAESTTWPPVADTMPTPLCNTSANADIMVMSTDDIALKNRIDDLV